MVGVELTGLSECGGRRAVNSATYELTKSVAVRAQDISGSVVGRESAQPN